MKMEIIGKSKEWKDQAAAAGIAGAGSGLRWISPTLPPMDPHHSACGISGISGRHRPRHNGGLRHANQPE